VEWCGVVCKQHVLSTEREQSIILSNHTIVYNLSSMCFVHYLVVVVECELCVIRKEKAHGEERRRPFSV
jgi:hypothetical protein